MILIRNCSCRCVCTTNFGRCGTVPIVLPNKTIVHFSVILVAAADGQTGRQFLLGPFVHVFLIPCMLFLYKLGIALGDRRHSMSPLSEGTGKLYMWQILPEMVWNSRLYKHEPSCIMHHHHHRRGSLFGRRKCHRYHHHHHHRQQQQRTKPITHPRLLPCKPTRHFPLSEKSSPPPFSGDLSPVCSDRHHRFLDHLRLRNSTVRLHLVVWIKIHDAIR
jgi:hypothetical protein